MQSSQAAEKFPSTPAASPASDEAHGPWWFPSWWEIAKLLGWRWLLAVPFVAILALLLTGTTLDIAFLGILWAIGIKTILIVLAIPIAVLASMMRSAVQMRSEPFCIHCGYSLTGLPDNHRCPECGRPYSFALVEEYRRNPHWFIQRARLARLHRGTQTPFAAGAVASPPSNDGT